jgi:translation initiation factor 2 beta subunit (eIF-2beta)/eIF-5
MKAECCLKNERLVRKYMKNETKCIICENTVFKVDRITPELIMLTCENCGEPHKIGVNSNESGIRLTFGSPETGADD